VKNMPISLERLEIQSLCNRVRELVRKGDISEGESIAIEAMKTHPHAPEPHNLLGVLLEKRGDHLLAMKHFRAAWALDPTYVPVRQNLDNFGTFFSTGKCAYDESDCLKDRPSQFTLTFNEKDFDRSPKKP